MHPNWIVPNPARSAAAVLAGAVLLLAAGPARAQRAEVPLNQAFDSAAVVAGLREISAPPPGMRPMFTAVFARGELKSVEPTLDGLPEAYAEAVAALLRARARTLSGGEALRQVYLRAEGGAAGGLSPHKWSAHPPRPLNVSQVQRGLAQVAARELALRGGEERPAGASSGGTSGGGLHSESHRPRQLETATLQIRMRVETDGSTTEHELMRPSNNPRINREALRIVRDLRCEPATFEGRPVRPWVFLPSNVRY